MTVVTASPICSGDTYASSASRPPAPLRESVDPLGSDLPCDDVVVTTRRAISRVALVATEAAGRFQREGVAHDPMTWMLTPRALFAGASALDACLEREDCFRGVLLHGLSLGLDAHPSDIDALTGDEEDEADDGHDGHDDDGHGVDGRSELLAAVEPENGGGDGDRISAAPRPAVSENEPRLFTAMVVAHDGVGILQAFHASLATGEAEVAGRLYMRMGAAMADAVIVEGFDSAVPLVAALVSPAICDTLALIAADPASPLAAGLDLNIEQRFLG